MGSSIFENKSKGWIFFFSEITDISLLYTLDHFVQKLCVRFNVSIVPNNFVKTYFQIKYRKYESQYIPNFDLYEIEDMKYVLEKYFKKPTTGMNDNEIEYNFKKRISR